MGVETMEVEVTGSVMKMSAQPGRHRSKHKNYAVEFMFGGLMMNVKASYEYGIGSYERAVVNFEITSTPPIAKQVVFRLFLDRESRPDIREEGTFVQGKFSWSGRLRVGPHGHISFDIEVLLFSPLLNESGTACSKRHAESMFQQYYDEVEGKDVELALTDSISNRIGCVMIHRFVLRACSEVFRDSIGNSKGLLLPYGDDVSMDDLNAFVQFMYGVIEEDVLFACKRGLLHLALELDVYYLRTACEDSMILDINSETVIALLMTAHQCGKLPKLKHRCYRFLIHFAKVYDVPHFQEWLRDVDDSLKEELMGKVVEAEDKQMLDYVSSLML